MHSTHTQHTQAVTIAQTDLVIAQALESELHRQRQQIELIASENIVSEAVLAAQGSVLTNKYAEGYPGHRYYGGCEHVDIVERLAIERLQELFSCTYANVQPHSGSQANQAVFLGLLQPGDTILGMSLSAGGHLTHGAQVNLSGKWFHAVHYGVDDANNVLDYEEIERLARECQPKMIIAGGSAYPRVIDFERFRHIADAVGAYLMVDMAHFAGLVAGGAYPNPLPYAHVVTSTTHKTLRGPRGGIILAQDDTFRKKLNSAIFPGLQGGPLMHIIAAKAVAFGEALSPAFRKYAQQVVTNARVMAQTLQSRGLTLVTGGTDSHLILVDLRPQQLTGKLLEEQLHAIGITCNKNSVPGDTASPMVTSGIRLGTPAITTRGFQEAEVQQLSHWIADVVESCQETGKAPSTLAQEVMALCEKFPLYTGVTYL